MAFRDILLALMMEPEPTRVPAIHGSVRLARALGARISAIACGVKSPAPASLLGNLLVAAPDLVASELERSENQARRLLTTFQKAAEREDVFCETILEHCLTSEVADMLTDHARLHDLTIFPLSNEDNIAQWHAEAIIFGSGRPTIIMPQDGDESNSQTLESILVAWDFSRSASRALADALPILQRAKETFVVTVTNEKTAKSRRCGVEVAENLAKHGVKVFLNEVAAGKRSVGEVLGSCIVDRRADLLVMGAYGHSRVREFLLGGTTKSMLSHPPIPILFSC